MAISKKSLGKVLAISMASAMAMSSLSAALVNVSAVQAPALASNGNVGFCNDGEEKIVAALRGDASKYSSVGDNKEVDTIVGNKFKLSDAFNEAFFEKILEYTDSDDLSVNDLDVTKITYRVSSGGSYASVKDDILTAKNSGSATLQIKVTADVDLGGGKSDKEVTFTHNVNIIVHDNAEIGLVAYDSASHSQYDRLSNDQLNDIAAYNADKLYFQLVSFRSQGNGDSQADGASGKTNVIKAQNGTETIDNASFAAIALNANIGDSASADIPDDKPNPPTEAIDKVVATDNLVKAGLASNKNAQAAFKALLTATDNNGTVSVTVANPADMSAALKTLVDAGTINSTDTLIPEVKDQTGAVITPAVTVQNVIDDETPAAGSAATKLAAALQSAVTEAGKPSVDPEQPTVPPTVSDIILVPANLMAAGLSSSTDAQDIFKQLFKTDANGETVVLTVAEIKTKLSEIVNQDKTKGDVELAGTEVAGDQKIKVSDVIADQNGVAQKIYDNLVKAANGATPGAALALKLDDAGVPSRIAGQIVDAQGNFNKTVYNNDVTPNTPVLVVNQAQAEAAVDAVTNEKPNAGAALGDGLYVDEVASAGATYNGKTAVLADTNTKKVYFAKADTPLKGLAAELLEEDKTSKYQSYVLADGTLSEAAAVAQTSEAITVYKPVTITGTKGLIKDKVPAEDMQKIVDAAKKAVTPDANLDTVAKEIWNNVKAKADAAGGTLALTEAKIKTFLSQDSNGLITLTWTTKANQQGLKDEIAFTVPGQGTEVEGFAITPAPFSNQLKKAAVDFTAQEATDAVEAQAKAPKDDSNNPLPTLDKNALYKWTDATNNKDYYFVQTDVNTEGIDLTIANLTTKVGDTGNDTALSALVEKDEGATLVHYKKADGSLVATPEADDGSIPVTIVTVKTGLTGVVKTPAVPFANEAEWKTYVDTQITTDIQNKATLGTGADAVIYIPADANPAPTPGEVKVEYADNTITTGGAKNLVYTIEQSGVVGTDTTGVQDTETKMSDLFFSTTAGETDGGDTAKKDIDTIVETAAKVDSGLLDVQSLIKAVKAAINLDTNKVQGAKLKSVRFYAGNGAELFEQESTPDSGKWEKGTKGGSKGYEVTADGKSALMELSTKGTTGAASVKAYVTLEGTDGKTVTEEYVLNLKVVKAADFGDKTVTMTKSGSKTLADQDLVNLPQSDKKSLSGYEIRTKGGVTVTDGNVGTIKADGTVQVDDGKTGDIIGAENVKVSGATVGNIVDAAGSIELTEGAIVGKVTTDGATSLKINDATVSSIDADCPVDIEGGEINGNVTTTGGTITITSEDEDADGDIMDVIINGNVISKGKGNGKISIDNESDEGKAEITIRGDVIARYANTDDNEESVKIGSSNTTGTISIGGAVQGEHIVLGGNGLVTLGAVNAVNEIERTDDEGIVVDSTLEFQGFNAGINNINKFANVTVSEGTVNVVSPLTTTTLDVQSDTQIVLSSLNVEDITGDGNIVVPAGQMVINGNVDDTPSLTLLGDVEVGTLAYSGDKGLSEAFDLGGLTLKAERQTNGTFNYTVSKQELYGVKAVGKNVTVGKDQAKSVTVVTDAALPQGASIQWRSDDAEVATVEGSGNTATITGVDIGSVDVTATIVDANGRDLGYENATFNVDVLHANTIEVVGSEIALDTKAVNLDVGQSYSFLVRENSDTDNITLSYDSNIVDIALAQADYNGRGALYTITAKANGSTNVTVNYKGASSSVAVKVGGFKLDTAAKDLAPGQTYSFLAKNVPADQAANVKLEYDTNVATVTLAQADYNGRGALFTVTGNQVGSTEIKATYNNEEATMAVNVVEYTGRMTLDTASYTMPFGGTYTIGVKIEQNGRQLSGEEVNAMIARDELRVRDSRTGTIINAPQVLANGNVRVTGKSTEGTTYVLFEVVQNGQVVTHASVGVTVQAGAQAGGSSRRSISQW